LTSLDVNRPEVVAQVRQVFTDYEAALVAGDNERLVEAFWDSPALVRFGLADRQAGAEPLRQWRMTQPPVAPGRRLSETTVATFGTDFAVVTTLFDYPDTAGTGRQSQTWVRTPAGWRIVSAHVSWCS
jgi:ketosteroid isomerase-like protein